MGKVFEDYFSDLQADMVSICLEYVSNRADTIYIHCICEDNSIFCNYFYKINGVVVKKHKLNDAISNLDDIFRYDTATNRQDAVLSVLNSDVAELIKVCAKNKRDMPTEIRLCYDVSKNSLDAQYRYDSIYEASDKSEYEISNEWFDELSNNNS